MPSKTTNGSPSLDRFFRPETLVVVGATESRPGLASITAQVMARADAVGARFIPVNPKVSTVLGRAAVASIMDIDGAIDVLVILTSDPRAIVTAAAGKDVGFVVAFANGYSELGTEAGARRERDLADAVAAIGARLIGPNTNANSLRVLDDRPPPKLAMVFQSGHQGAPIAQSQELGVALSYWAPTGNEADLEVADFIEYFAADDDTRAICGYIEGFKSGARLRAAAVAAIEHETPLVLVKVGRSDAGRSMAISHTGHLAGTDEIYDAFFEQYGITRVDDLDELLEVSVALCRSPVPDADGVAVISISGGTAAHLADLAVASGLPLPPLSDAAQQELHTLIPAEFRVSNPVDTGGQNMADGRGAQLIDAVQFDPAIGVVMFPITGTAPGLTEVIGESLLQAQRASSTAVFVIWSGPTTTHPVHQQLWDAGFPVFRNFRNAISAAHALLAHPSRNPELHEQVRLTRALPAPSARHPASVVFDEAESSEWLEARGIPFARRRTAATVDDAVAAAEALGFPVVVKGVGAAHKSEAGLVVLGLANGRAVRDTAADLLGRAGVDELLIAEQIRDGIEMLVGVTHDPLLGPVIVVGAGGTEAEALGDVSRSVVPLTRSRAERMVAGLRVSRLLDGWRGQPAVDVSSLVDTIMRVAELATTERLLELDINPLLVRVDGVVGLDALVRLGVDTTA